MRQVYQRRQMGFQGTPVMGRTVSPGGSRSKKRPKQIYTIGERNKMIDSTIHPLSKVHPAFTLIDGLLHVINEGDLKVSLQKFVKYSLPELIRMLLEDEV